MLQNHEGLSRYVNRALASPVLGDSSGWVPAGETWTRTGATTFTVAADVTSKYGVGDKIRYKQTAGTWCYGYIAAVSAYAGGVTTITVASGSDYTLAAETITDNYYSKASSPQGFPHWFNWVPTYTSSGTMTYGAVTGTAKFTLNGRLVTVQLFVNGTTGGSATWGIYVTLPFAATPVCNFAVGGIMINDAAYIAAMMDVSSTYFRVFKAALANWGIGAARQISASFSYGVY